MSLPTFFASGALHSGSSMFGPLTNTISQATNNRVPSELPNVETLIDLSLRGWIGFDTLTVFCRNNGVSIDPYGKFPEIASPRVNAAWTKAWNATYFSKQAIPTPTELFVLNNRRVITDDRLDTALRRHAFVDDDTRKQMANLKYEVPGPSDLVRFAVRHVFEPDLVRDLNYPAERDKGPYLLDVFHQCAGINYPIFTGPLAGAVKAVTGQDPAVFAQMYISAGMREPTWADAYWWSHWVLPSAGQGYEMLFRLDEDRDRSFDPPFAKELNFSLKDLNLLLRANDYPPFYREKLAAIAYRIPGIRFMRELIRTGSYSLYQVYWLLRRQGYSDGDSTALTNMLGKTDAEAKNRQAMSAVRGILSKSYEIGVLSRDDYLNQLTKLGLTFEQAQRVADLADAVAYADRAKRVITFVRRQFVSGKVTRDQAGALLHQAGILEPRLSQYLDEWALDIQGRHREVNAASAVRLACRGLITGNDLNIRLVNLGYSNEDIAALMAEAAQCAQDRSDVASAKADRATRMGEAEARRRKRESDQRLRNDRRALASHGSPNQLRKWFCEYLVGEPEVYDRLRFLGWTDPDIHRLLADCKPAKGGGRQPTGGGIPG